MCWPCWLLIAAALDRCSCSANASADGVNAARSFGSGPVLLDSFEARSSTPEPLWSRGSNLQFLSQGNGKGLSGVHGGLQGQGKGFA